MLRDAREATTGRWYGILSAIGVDEKTLSGRHGPCPICGGRDRFRFDDKDGRGTYYCSGCGPGDGFGLIMKLRDMDFRSAIDVIEPLIGVTEKITPNRDDPRKSIRRIISGCLPAAVDDAVGRYLRGRGISVTPSVGHHPGLAYFEGKEKIGTWPAMIGVVRDSRGQCRALHRTWISDGRKAPVASPKKLTSATGSLSGCAIRLFPAGEMIGIAEGIETACAATQLTGIPTWSVISAGLLEQFELPDGVGSMVVFGDNDENYTGQKAAYALAHRMAMRGVAVEVRIPPKSGTDWADALK